MRVSLCQMKAPLSLFVGPVTDRRLVQGLPPPPLRFDIHLSNKSPAIVQNLDRKRKDGLSEEM